ncbi:hypothetical protein PM082_013478 [Marasmius tenuissimus]|nr:hypothetical protein PM082_013478 [Marasmius tenuissimus]
MPPSLNKNRATKPVKASTVDTYQEERMEIALGSSNRVRPSSLGRALQAITDLQYSLKKSRHNALLGHDLELGELVDPECTFNDILEAVSGLPASGTLHALGDESIGQSQKLELENTMKKLCQHREMDAYIAAMASVGPQLTRHLEGAFDYIASQRRGFGVLLEKAHPPDLSEMVEKLNIRVSHLAERCEKLKVKVMLTEPEVDAFPCEPTTRSTTECSSCSGLGAESAMRGQDAAVKDVESMDEGHSDDLMSLDHVVKETSSTLNSSRLQELERGYQADTAKLAHVEAVAKERKRSFQSVVDNIVSHHRAWPDFQGIREGMIREMEAKEENMVARCLDNVEMAARIQAISTSSMQT